MLMESIANIKLNRIANTYKIPNDLERLDKWDKIMLKFNGGKCKLYLLGKKNPRPDGGFFAW